MDRRAQLERSLKGLDKPKEPAKRPYEIGDKGKRNVRALKGSIWKIRRDWANPIRIIVDDKGRGREYPHRRSRGSGYAFSAVNSDYTLLAHSEEEYNATKR